MKVLVISDIHGSSYYAKKIKEINKKDNIIYKNDGGNRKMKHILRKSLS